MIRWTAIPLAAAALLLWAGPAAAAEREVQVLVDGKPLVTDVQPYIEQGRVMVPLRTIAEAFGIRPQWDASTATVHLRWGSHEVSLTIGQGEARVDGRALTLDAPAVLRQGRTFVPLRFVSEGLGGEATWDAAASAARIASPAALEQPLEWRYAKPEELPATMRGWLESIQRDGMDRPFFFMDMVGGGTTYALIVWPNRPTSGYEVRVERVYLRKGTYVVIDVRLVEPPPDAVVTQVISHPYVAIAIDGAWEDVRASPNPEP